jgi:hypothetical protein
MSVCARVATAHVDVRGQLVVVFLSFFHVSPGIALRLCELVAGVFSCLSILLSSSILVKWAAFIVVMIRMPLGGISGGTLSAHCVYHSLHWWMTMTLECFLNQLTSVVTTLSGNALNTFYIPGNNLRLFTLLLVLIFFHHKMKLRNSATVVQHSHQQSRT